MGGEGNKSGGVGFVFKKTKPGGGGVSIRHLRVANIRYASDHLQTPAYNWNKSVSEKRSGSVFRTPPKSKTKHLE